MSRENVARPAAPAPGRRARRTPLERFALRFPGVACRIAAIVPRLTARNPTLAQFRALVLAANEAFNRGDFATAFAALAPDCEWHPFEESAEGGVLVGPEQVARFFADLADTFPGFRNEPVHFLQVGDGVFVVLWRVRGTGGASSVPTAIAHGGLWELREGVPVRVREFTTWEETLSAAGLDPSTAAELRGAERSGGRPRARIG